MIDVRGTAECAAFSATVGLIDGGIAAGIAALIAGQAAAATTFAIVGGVSTVFALGGYAMCKAAAAADEAIAMME